MNLYIQIENGQPINHPAFADNLRQAFGDIPSNWEPFIRVAKPVPGVYEILVSEEPTYQKVDDVWMDVWNLRPMTDEEKNNKQQEVKNSWSNRPQASNWSSWTFNESTCTYVPPVPKPSSEFGKNYFWCGEDNNWKESPLYPEDGKLYDFDYLNWQWVLINE